MPSIERMRNILIDCNTLKYRSKEPGSSSILYYTCIDLISGEEMWLRINKSSQIRGYLKQIEKQDQIVVLKCCKHGRHMIKWGEYEPTYGYVSKVSKQTDKDIRQQYVELLV